MLLAIDIGNSAIKFGLFDGESLISRFSVSTKLCCTDADFSSVRTSPDFSVTDAVACSVVPQVEQAVERFVAERFGVGTFFVDNTFDFGLKIKYETADTLGTDRLVSAFAACRYGVPVIVCNFGTATTIDAVSNNREFLGGAIAPGFASMADALHLRAAKLPRVEIAKPESAIGTSTVESIRSGIFYSQIGLVETVVALMKGRIGSEASTAAAGGFARLIAESTAAIDIVEPDLLLIGLQMLYSARAGGGSAAICLPTAQK